MVSPARNSIHRPATFTFWRYLKDPSWKFAAVDVTRYMPNRDAARPWRVIGTLKGVSVKSRAIWKDEVSKKARWRLQDLDSYLTQGAQQ